MVFFVLIGVCLTITSVKAINIDQQPLIPFDQDVNLIHQTKTEKVLNDLLRKRNFIGTVTIIKNNHLVYQQGFGYANKQRGLKNSGKVTYQIASIQKTMTAYLLFKTALSKGFSLNTPVSRFYPQIKNANQITIRNLLTMTSGIDNQIPIRHPMDSDKLIKYTVKRVQINPQKIGILHYQPLNYVLLAGIVQIENNSSYYHCFRKQIINRLKLKSAYFYQDLQSYQNCQAQGYHYKSQNPYVIFHEDRIHYDQQLGTGNIYMTNGDLYFILRSFLNGSLISSQQVNDLYSPGNTNSTYLSGLYSVRQRVPSLLGEQYTGYHFHGIEFGFETVGDISKNGADAVILTSNSANYQINNNYILDIPIYRQLIDDRQIF